MKRFVRLAADGLVQNVQLKAKDSEGLLCTEDEADVVASQMIVDILEDDLFDQRLQELLDNMRYSTRKL